MKIQASRINKTLDLTEDEELFFNRLIKNNKEKKIITICRDSYESIEEPYYSSSIQISHEELKENTERIFDFYKELIPVWEPELYIYVNTEKSRFLLNNFKKNSV